MTAVRVLKPEATAPAPDLSKGIDAFLESLRNAGTRRNYAGTLRALMAELGSSGSLAMLDEPGAPDVMSTWFNRRWGDKAPPQHTIAT